MTTIQTKLSQRAKVFKRQTLVVYFSAHDPRTPRSVRLLALMVAAYALSPVDLIPDFIPPLGYLDDLILLPLAITLIVKLTPPEVIAGAKQQASTLADRPTSFDAAVFIVAIWAAPCLRLLRVGGSNLLTGKLRTSCHQRAPRQRGGVRQHGGFALPCSMPSLYCDGHGLVLIERGRTADTVHTDKIRRLVRVLKDYQGGRGRPLRQPVPRLTPLRPDPRNGTNSPSQRAGVSPRTEAAEQATPRCSSVPARPGSPSPS